MDDSDATRMHQFVPRSIEHSAANTGSCQARQDTDALSIQRTFLFSSSSRHIFSLSLYVSLTTNTLILCSALSLAAILIVDLQGQKRLSHGAKQQLRKCQNWREGIIKTVVATWRGPD